MASKAMLKNVLYAFNVLVVISGLLLTITGAMTLHNINKTTSMGIISTVPTAFIFIGLLILALAFVGYYGAYKENTCMLVSYGTIMIIFAIIQIIFGCISFASKSQLKTLKVGQQYMFDEKASSYWDFIQPALQCCGVDGPQDYNNQLRPIPDSCCITTTYGICDQYNAYQKGCYQVLYEQASKILNIIGGLAIAFGLLNFLGGVCACCLTKAERESGVKMAF